MHPLESVPAVRRLDTDRSDVFAIEITNHVRAADVENLYGLLEGAYALHDRLDLFVRFRDCDGVDWSEVSHDTARDGREHAHQHIRRCAIVGPDAVARELRGFLDLSNAGETRRFGSEEEAEAWAWIEAREVTERL